MNPALQATGNDGHGRAPDLAARHRPTVFFDGACPLCRREIGAYRHCRGGDGIDWVDARGADTAALGRGLSQRQALARLHVRTRDGTLVSGAAAFIEIWSALPAFAPLGRFFRAPAMKRALELLYRGFLVIRPALQRVATRLERPGTAVGRLRHRRAWRAALLPRYNRRGNARDAG